MGKNVPSGTQGHISTDSDDEGDARFRSIINTSSGRIQYDRRETNRVTLPIGFSGAEWEWASTAQPGDMKTWGPTCDRVWTDVTGHDREKQEIFPAHSCRATIPTGTAN